MAKRGRPRATVTLIPKGVRLTPAQLAIVDTAPGANFSAKLSHIIKEYVCKHSPQIPILSS